MSWGLSLEIWTQFLSCRLGRAANVIFLDVHLSCRQLGCILGNALAPLKTVSGCHDIQCSYTACGRNPSRIAAHSSKSEHRQVETWQKPINLHSVKRLHMRGKRKVEESFKTVKSRQNRSPSLVPRWCLVPKFETVLEKEIKFVSG